MRLLTLEQPHIVSRVKGVFPHSGNHRNLFLATATEMLVFSPVAKHLVLRLCIKEVVHYRDDDRHALHQRDVRGVGQNGQSRC